MSEEQQEQFIPSPREARRQKHIDSIQYNAAHPKLADGIKKEITFQQSLSILLRRKQLVQEGRNYSYDVRREKMKQTEECYLQRAKQKQ